jgi:sugar lactone lactonase YvrE
MIKPYGLTVQGGKVYICDAGLGGLVILDLANASFEYFIPGGKGQLKLPINCCFDDRGHLYVADANRGQIVVFDQERNFLHAFGEGEQFRPTDIAVHQGKIWVCNVRDHALYIYGTDDYEFIGKRPDLGQEEDGFIRQATNIAIHDSNLYISDFGDFNIKRYSLEGDYLGSFGGYGNAPGSFTRPKGLALDSTGNLYAVDAAFENVQIFNSAGDLLMHFGGAYEGAGAMWLPASVEISYENLAFFEPYVDESFRLKYLIYVSNQYGPAKVNVYGFVEEKSHQP